MNVFVLNAFLLHLIGSSIGLVLENVPAELDWNSCPNIRTIDNFKPSRFSGVWFDSYRYMNAFFTGRCGRASFRWFNDHERFNLTYSHLEGFDTMTLKAIDLYGGVFRAYHNGRRTPLIFYVLDTDYHNYAVIWTCTDIMYGAGNAQTLNVFSRKRNIESFALSKAKNAISSRNLDEDKLNKVNQNHEICGGRSRTLDYYDDY